MTIATDFGSLKAAVAEWIVRSDLDARMEDFCLLVEARINRDLRVREMVMTATGTLDGPLTLPADFLGIEVIRANTTPPRVLTPVSATWGHERQGTNAFGSTPRYFAIVGGSLLVFPEQTGNVTPYTLDYYATIPTICTSSSTWNWLLRRAPDAYLFGMMAEAHRYLLEPDKADFWLSQFDRTISSLNAKGKRERIHQGPVFARQA